MSSVRHGKVVAELPALSRYARSLTGDASAAEDLVHDTLVAAYANAATFREGGSVKLWLLSILHNRFVSDRRRAKTAERAIAALAPAAEAAPDQETRIVLRQVAEALARLPAEQREALHLVVVEGLSYQAAAETLAIPIGTLMSRISRARAKLRQLDADAAPPARLRLVEGSSRC